MPVSSKKSSKASKATKAKKESKTQSKVQKAGSKTKASKAKVTKAKAKATPVKQSKQTDTESSATKSARSFKVMLPGTEDFVGRFTGLTPYQAANKALSKYYRETSKPKKEIRFSIKESTRGSKRGTYTYNGARQKLAEPVKYTISSKDGEDKEIVKKFKNRLTKVKKSELAASE